MFVFRVGIHTQIVRIANREDPDQTASSEQTDLGLSSFFFVFLAGYILVFEILEHLL